MWILAFIIVVAAALYQRITGPTWPVRGAVMVGQQQIKYRSLRSQEGQSDAEIRVAVPDRSINGFVRMRRTPSTDEWRQEPMNREGEFLVAWIPHQPPAGKVMYHIFLDGGAGPIALTPEPVTLRYKGVVPGFILYPHITLMFLAMLFSTRCGLEALVKGPAIYKLSLWTVVSLCAGGLILGPVVQKLAFGALWTGWPLGRDLTDNKTIVAALLWIIALWRVKRRREAMGWPLAASIVLILVYSIPHSVLGSQLDYTRLPQGAPKS